MISPGDHLAEQILHALDANRIILQSGDVLVIAQKIISKAEDRCIELATINPSNEAILLAKEVDKDPRIVELILSESDSVMRKKPGVLITRHRLGLVGAHAGIDQSNVDHAAGESALLLPRDPDASASKLLAELMQHAGVQLGLIISDSMNRPWRMGTVGCAIGSAGISVLDDYRGGTDIFGRELKVTLINRADAIASAATLVMGETTEKIPLVIVRGFSPEKSDSTAKDIIRPLDEDMFL